MAAKKKKRRKEKRQPFGILAGLLAGSLATLVGVASGLDPFVIFCRASISALVTAMTVGIGISIVHIANLPQEDTTTTR